MHIIFYVQKQQQKDLESSPSLENLRCMYLSVHSQSSLPVHTVANVYRGLYTAKQDTRFKKYCLLTVGSSFTGLSLSLPGLVLFLTKAYIGNLIRCLKMCYFDLLLCVNAIMYQ